MPLRRKPLIATAIAVAAFGVAAVVAGLRSGTVQARAAPPTSSLSVAARTSLALCREHVAMAHDVQWAASCISNARGHSTRMAACMHKRGADAVAQCEMLVGPEDDSADCMLPDDQAGRLNAALAKSENRCIEQAVAEDGGAVRTARLGWLRH